MNQELLEQIIDVIDSDEQFDENTVIADHPEDIDSLAFFNIIVLLKAKGFTGKLIDIQKCKTLGDLTKLIN